MLRLELLPRVIDSRDALSNSCLVSPSPGWTYAVDDKELVWTAGLQLPCMHPRYLSSSCVDLPNHLRYTVGWYFPVHYNLSHRSFFNGDSELKKQKMGILTSIDVGISKPLLYGIAAIIFFAILASRLHNSHAKIPSIPHAPRIPYKLPFGQQPSPFLHF